LERSANRFALNASSRDGGCVMQNGHGRAVKTQKVAFAAIELQRQTLGLQRCPLTPASRVANFRI